MTRSPTRLTRRDVLQRAAIGGTALPLSSLLLAACGGSDADTLTVSNWPFYVDANKKTHTHPSIEQFETRTGVQVKYVEEINDNESFFGKIQAQLAAGDAGGRDVIVPSDWLAARLIRLGYVQKLNKQAIPNLANLLPSLRHPSWDPKREYSLPWYSFLTGIAYNSKALKSPVTSVDQLFDDPQLKGRVTVLSEMADTVGLTMLAGGDDPAKVTPDAFDRAIARVKRAHEAGQIRQFVGEEFIPLLSSGDALAAIVWSGETYELSVSKPEIKFVIPDAGGLIASDNMMIPVGGDVDKASRWMNFYYQPGVRARMAQQMNFPPPVRGTRERLAKSDPERAGNEVLFPSNDTYARLHGFDVEAADKKEYKEKFQALIGA